MRPRAILKSMCYGGLCPLNVDNMWDLFEPLASYQWQCECASDSLVCSSSLPYDLHAQSPFLDQVRDVFDHHSSYLHVVYSYCQSFDHNANSYPYNVVSNES